MLNETQQTQRSKRCYLDVIAMSRRQGNVQMTSFQRLVRWECFRSIKPYLHAKEISLNNGMLEIFSL